MKIVVLAGGLSPERNVSRSTGAKVCAALRERGHRAALVDLYFGLEDYEGELEDCFDAPISDEWKQVGRQAPDLEAVRAARKWKGKSAFGKGVLELCAMADIVFLALHGRCGEDGRVQAAFDLLGIPYTGAGCLSTAIAMDKDLTKRLVAERVTTPGWKTVEYTAADIDALVASARLPLVVKPVDSGSSIGVSIAFTQQELRRALERALQQLADDQRQILLLREVGGLSYDEIARELDLEAGTVKSRIFRARKKLCKLLMEDGNFSPFSSSNQAKGV